MHLFTYTLSRICVCMYVCIYIYMYIYIYIYLYIYIYIHTHVYLYNICMYVSSFRLSTFQDTSLSPKKGDPKRGVQATCYL